MIKQEFETFPKKYLERLQICRHEDDILNISMLTLTGLLNDLVAADREGNWEGHLQVIQILLSFSMSGSINYLRYGNGYLEKMRKVFHEVPEVQKHLQERIRSENKCNIL